MKRPLLFLLGWLALILGIVGIFLPVLPTAPFVILAAWCFFRSSPKLHARLMENRVVGPMLRDWENRRAIARRTKIKAIAMIALSAAFMWWKVRILPLKIGVSVLLIAVSAFILTRRE